MVASATEPVRVDLAIKLLRRAVDPACPVPEAENSATKFVTVSRRDGITFDRIVAALAPAPRHQRQKRRREAPSPPPACSIKMPHGRHSGRTLLDIGEHDLPYLKWVAREHSDVDLADAAAAVLHYLGGRAA